MNEQSTHILPIGTKIHEFTILKILGEGGFGITYLAQDTQLDRQVAIKEYFPTDISIRDHDSIKINPKTNTEDNYKYGLEKFLEEAKTLAQFTHPNIVRVTRFIETNNTAYLIMDYEQGEDLGDYLKRINFTGNMPETELKSYLIPILKGLQAVHDKGLLHRDVKPGNIYLRKDAEPMLIDFGAARYALGEHSKSMSAIISMGYAPPEQYSTKGKQNQATDLYAWAATAYKLITGKTPIESPDRLNAIFEDGEDLLQPLTQTHYGKYSKNLLTTIDNCLQVSNKNRPQSANQVIAMLTGEKAPINKTEKVKPEERFKNTKPSHSETGTKYVKDHERFANTKETLSSSTPIGDPSRRKPKKSKLSKLLTVSLFTIALITAGYYGYNYYQTQQQKAEQTKQVQRLLVKLGYTVTVTGKLEARTQAAILDFEKKQGILETGVADSILITSLQKAIDIKAEKQRQSKIAADKKAEQQRLAKLAQEKEERQRQDKLAAKIALGKDGTIKDKSRNLMWMRCSLGQTWNKNTANCDGKAKRYTFDDAQGKAKGFSYAGYSDWRVPTREELETLVYCSTSKKPRDKDGGLDGCTGNHLQPTIDKSKFPNTPGFYFWSASPLANDTSRAWDVSFGAGSSSYSIRHSDRYVRLVRFGQ